MGARLGHIDGLRGLAAVSVAIAHWFEIAGRRSPDDPFLHSLAGFLSSELSPGRFGIVAFFCISGFVIPFSFRGETPLRSFVVSRVFRLYPAYWLSLIMAVMLAPFVGMQFPNWQIAANATMLQQALRVPDVLGVYWTLFIELLFYGICFVAFAGRQLRSPAFHMLMMLLMLDLSLVGAAWRWFHPASGVPVGLPTYLAAMHFGTLARLHLVEKAPGSTRLYWIALPVVVIVATLANVLAYLHATNELLGWRAATSGYLIGILLFLFCVHGRVFGGRVLATLGAWSYAIYLFHPLFLLIAGYAWTALVDRTGFLLLTFAYGAGVLILSWAVHIWVEIPGQKLGRRVDRLVGSRWRPLVPAR